MFRASSSSPPCTASESAYLGTCIVSLGICNGDHSLRSKGVTTGRLPGYLYKEEAIVRTLTP